MEAELIDHYLVNIELTKGKTPKLKLVFENKETAYEIFNRIKNPTPDLNNLVTWEKLSSATGYTKFYGPSDGSHGEIDQRTLTIIQNGSNDEDKREFKRCIEYMMILKIVPQNSTKLLI